MQDARFSTVSTTLNFQNDANSRHLRSIYWSVLLQCCEAILTVDRSVWEFISVHTELLSKAPERLPILSKSLHSLTRCCSSIMIYGWHDLRTPAPLPPPSDESGGVCSLLVFLFAWRSVLTSGTAYSVDNTWSYRYLYKNLFDDDTQGFQCVYDTAFPTGVRVAGDTAAQHSSCLRVYWVYGIRKKEERKKEC